MTEATDDYDLCTAPWLPCLDLDGKPVHVGLIDALVRAHELRGLADPSPLVTAALTRLLLAIVHRSIDGPKTMAAWLDLVRQGRFPASRVTDYLARVRNRMNLFDAERPFAQVRGLDVEPADAATLVTQRSNWGAGTGLFHHRPEGRRASLDPGAAGRWLLAIQSFGVSGRISGRPGSATAGPLTAAAVVLVRGESLFETLITNLLIYAPDRSQPIPAHGSDLPHWEQEPQFASLEADLEPKRVPTGWIGALTWLSRRIELVVDNGYVVSWKRAAWQGLAPESARDPMVAWILDEKTGPRAVRIDSGRSFWRNSHALFEGVSRDDQERRRPAALAQLAKSEVRQVFPGERRFTIDVLGIATKKNNPAAIEVERWDRIVSSASLLADPDAADEVRGGIEVAEAAFDALCQGIETFARHAVAPGGRKPEPGDVRKLLDGLAVEAEYWNASEAAFSRFLERLSAGERQSGRKALVAEVRKIAESAFDRGVRALGEQGRMARAAALASTRFRARVASLLSETKGAS